MKEGCLCSTFEFLNLVSLYVLVLEHFLSFMFIHFFMYPCVLFEIKQYQTDLALFPGCNPCMLCLMARLCSLAYQERVQQYEGFVTDHQTYNDAYNGCVDWLNSIREKLSACSDVSGDRHAIQSRLDKIQVSLLALRVSVGEKVVLFVVVEWERRDVPVYFNDFVFL